MAHGVWERHRQDGGVFDSRILAADAASSRFCRNMSYVTAMRAAVKEKKIYSEGPGWELYAFRVYGGWGYFSLVYV